MGAKTSTEVLPELELRKREDPAYRAELERRESEAAERSRLVQITERPVLDDLRALGLDLNDIWHLYEIPDSRPLAIPILLKHLALDYPDGVLEGIGVGLDDRSARDWWSDLREMMFNTDREVVQDGLAVALSGCAIWEHYDDLLTFIRAEELGGCRIYFLRPINRIGNRISVGMGRAVVETVAEDTVLGTEATAILRGRSQNQ